jgi:hypothetical protein
MNPDPNCLTWLEGPDRSLERGLAAEVRYEDESG